jgi:hypothetical protein
MGRFRKSGKSGAVRRKSTKRRVGGGIFWDSPEEKAAKAREAEEEKKRSEFYRREALKRQEAKEDGERRLRNLKKALDNVEKCRGTLADCKSEVDAYKDARQKWGEDRIDDHFKNEKLKYRINDANFKTNEMTRRANWKEGGRKKTRKHRKRKRSRSRRR